MDQFAAEARQISKILNFWDFGFFIGALKKHAHENSTKRIQLVLQEYFKEKDSALSLNSLQNDAQTIKEIFPESSLEEITALLEEIGNEDSRIRIVSKMLLRKNNKTLLKRTYSGDVTEHTTTSKKTRIATQEDIFSGNNRPSTSTACAINETSANASNGEAGSVSEISSQSTITYSFEPLEVNEVTAEDRDILLSIIERNLNDKKTNNEPSSSSIDQPNNGVTSMDNLIPKIANETILDDTTTSNTENSSETSYVSMIVDNDPMLLKLAKVTSMEDYPQTNVNGNNLKTGDLPIAEEVSENLPATSTSTNRVAIPSHADRASSNNLSVTIVEKTSYPTTFNTINIKLPDNVASTSKSPEKPDNDKFHLYDHLMDMFANVSRRDIKTICKRYHASKRQKPPDNIFNDIISDLIELASSSKENSSDDSDKSDKVHSTIIVPHSPEGKKQPKPTPELLPLTNDAERNFQERPLNLIARLPTPIIRKAVFSYPERNTVIDAVEGVESASPKRENVAPAATSSVAKPPNPVNDMLDEILTDLIEAASDSEEEQILADTDMKEMEQDNRLIYHLMEMFPEACPQFIRKICKGKTNKPGVLDDLISRILEIDYPKRQKAESPHQQMDVEEQLEILKQILPDADPSYLQMQCDCFINKPDEMKVFIANALETRSYPKLKDYLRNQQISAQQKQYTTEFSVDHFLEVIPDPVAYFEDPKRKQSKVDFESHHYALCFLRNHFSKISLRIIRELFKKNGENFLLTFKALEKFSPSLCMKSKRGECRMPDVIRNIPLLQEIAYVKHQAKIEEHIRLQKVKEEQEQAAAKAAGLLQTCSCCFDDEVQPKYIYTCDNGCIFCKECVQRGAEVAYGDGKLDFACLNNCSSHFSLQTLQAVLKPKLFSKIAIKKQLEEVKAAGIEDLEMCPFCDFATIPAKDDKLFRCLNPECMKESCRLCKEPSHVPLRCEEVEKEDDVKIRTYIENKMTEALLRTCYKCNKKFIKAEGCNKMTCSCGALMCYVCGKPVKDYKHFNGAGGDRFDLCPLYSDTNHMHEEAVLKGAEAAKKEIGLDSNSKLKVDPTADVQKHYKEIAKKNPGPPIPPYVANPFLGYQQHLHHVPDMLNMNMNMNNVFVHGHHILEQQQFERQRNIARRQQQHHRHGHHHHH